MLGERDYMRRRQEPEQTAASGKTCLYALIAINVLVWMLKEPLAGDLVLSTHYIRNLELWRFVTAAFTHVDFWHLFFNMFGLWMFGSISAQVLGWKNFLNLYLICGTFGNLLWYLLNLHSGGYLLGASGAVVGIIMATAMIVPEMRVLMLFFPVPIKLKTMAIVYIILEVVQQMTNSHSGVAYLAHIGGFIAGCLFMHIFQPREINWSPLAFLFRPGTPQNTHRAPRGWTVSDYHKNSGPVSQNELDRILDKLSRTGINSLTEEELETLRKAREQMKSR